MAIYRFLLLSLFLPVLYGQNKHPVYPESFDCPMRQLALEFACFIQPWLSLDKLQQIADALRGSKEARNCTINVYNTTCSQHKSIGIHSPIQEMHNSVFIDPNIGDDIFGNGSISKPYKSIQRGLNHLRNHVDAKTAIIKHILLRKGVHYLSKTLNFYSSDSNLKISNYNNENVIMSGSVPLNDIKWILYKNGSNNISNYFYTKISEKNITSIPGLRVSGIRAVRARYPNVISNEYYPPGFGSNLKAAHWSGAIGNVADQIFKPVSPYRNDSYKFQQYVLGIGGVSCPFITNSGYWCAHGSGGAAGPFEAPKSMNYTDKILPNAPYSNPTGGIVHSWRPAHWFSWMFEIDANKYDPKNRNISFLRGGYQGARGAGSGQEIFVENVFEELDFQNEWFYNETTKMLYYRNNGSAGNMDPNSLQFEAVQLKVLMNFTGSMDKPIENITINGIIFKDTAITYMDPHGIPSGGDWTLQRTGSIYIDGCSNFHIYNNTFTRLDNIAISINKYNRNHSIYRNEFVWLGGSAVTLWGNSKGSPVQTMGPDGTDGEQPRFINVSSNFIHEIGIWEKQSSAYFQAKSCQNTIESNIFFNGPRAMINFNDGFGGSSLIKNNLLFNSCRESSDHGPFNSWDRQVYTTNTNSNGTPIWMKRFDVITRNFIMGNYGATFAIDNDDGSCFYDENNNFLVYSTEGGLKNDFGGHSIYSTNNIYAYIGSQCFGVNNQFNGYQDKFENNSCIIYSTKFDSTNYGSFDCSNQTDKNQWPQLGNNKIYIRNQSVLNLVGLCGLNEKQFQQKYNIDLQTSISAQINNYDIIQQARNILFV